MAGNGATTAPTVTTQPDGTVEISVTSQTAGISTVTATINSSSQSRDVTFIADVRTAQIADLEVTRDNSVADGAMANMLRARLIISSLATGLMVTPDSALLTSTLWLAELLLPALSVTFAVTV